MKKYMVVEHFHQGCPEKVYDRFHAKGRMLPEGLDYIDSWLSADRNTCFQLMQTESFPLFQQWTENWEDLVRFEIIELGEKPDKSEKRSG